MKKTLAIFLILMLCIASYSAAFAEGNELRIVTRNIGSAVDNETQTQKVIEEKTGLDITWEFVPAGQYQTTCQLMIASGDYPDMMLFHSSTYPNELQQLADDGVLMPLDELLEEYGQPILDHRPDYTFFKSETDGKTYGIAARLAEYDVGTMVWIIRQDWLDALNLSVPTNYQEWHDMLVAFKENSELLVGSDKEVIPLGQWGGSIDLVNYFMSETGNVGGQWNVVDGELVYYINTPGYKTALERVRQLYQEGLMDPEFLIQSKDNASAKAFEGIYGVMYMGSDQIDNGTTWGDTYHENNPDSTFAIAQYPVDENGIGARAQLIENKQIIFFANSENAVNGIKLLNYLVSDEGVKLAQLGIEGESWQYTDDGKIQVNELTDAQRVSIGSKSFYLVMMQGYLTPTECYSDYIIDYFLKATEMVVPVPVVACTDTYILNGTAMSNLMKSYEARLITEENIDFDVVLEEYLAEWAALGGTQWTAEMNAEYQKVQ